MVVDAFVLLAEFLRPDPPEPALEFHAAQAAEGPSAAEILELDEALRAARRFRAALADALDAAVQELLPILARDVLARELLLKPADLGAIVAAALVRCAGENVLAVRVQPRDLAALDGLEFERIPDASLEPGDLRLHLRSGTIDCTLATRLDRALSAWV
ncbi:MAG TPA: FliH/SctL family protein [Candidatus Cybelea sp.]|nr:FliH/SctL family protein [Candidatus Cybelea sp.]